MKRIATLLVLAGLSLAVMGCTTVAPMGATSNPVGSKVGESTASFLFGYLPTSMNQDYSIATAAANGGISKISTYDLKVTNYLGFFATVTTTVTGE